MHSSLGLDVVGRALDFPQGRIPGPLSSRAGEKGEDVWEREAIGRREGSVNICMEKIKKELQCECQSISCGETRSLT